MPLTINEDHISTLSGDTGVLKDGRKLATPAKWSDVGASDEAAWGACQGSAKEPYKVAVDLGGGEPGYKCNCPSRKFPCKHVIGLLYLILDQQPAPQEPPGWASSWLAGRRQRAEAKANTAPKADSDVPSPATAKSEAAREAKVRAGMEELRLWLRDLARRGLADSTIKTYEFWDRMAARLVDAQASALAKRLRALAGLPFQVKTN
jgi:hypothetical protein